MVGKWRGLKKTMKITLEEVLKFKLCPEAEKWAINKYKAPIELKSVIKDLEKIKQLDWANWLIARLLSNDDKIKFAIFTAEQVLWIYEKKYPDDLRPRKAIEAAKEYLRLKTDAAADAAANAADAAYAAADAAAYMAANAAVYAVYAATNVATNAAAEKKMQLKIVNYGLGLLQRFYRGNR